MIFLIKNYFNAISLILISIVSIINSECITFNNETISPENSCQINRAQNFSENSYRECLQCFINFQHIESITNTCDQKFECIEFQFYDNTAFENFFYNYLSSVEDLFENSNISQSRNILQIKILHNTYTKIGLDYIQSVLELYRTDYSYLYLSFYNHENSILLDLNTANLSNTFLTTIRIEIVCDKNITYVYDIHRNTEPAIHSNICMVTPPDNNKTSSPKTTTRTRTSSEKILLFIGGLTVFLIWILCICLCLYLGYYKWKINDHSNQRASIVSSMFSADSFDTEKDDILFSNQINEPEVVKSLSHHSVYSFDYDL